MYITSPYHTTHHHTTLRKPVHLTPPCAYSIRLHPFQTSEAKLRDNVEWEDHMNQLRTKRGQPTEFHRHRQASKMRELLPRLARAGNRTAALAAPVAAWPLRCYTADAVADRTRGVDQTNAVHPSIAAFLSLPTCRHWRFCEPNTPRSWASRG